MFQILAGENHTTMLLMEDKQHLLCWGTTAPGGNPSNSCGKDNKPAAGQHTDPLVLLSANMDPQGPGSSIRFKEHANQWRKNQYTVKGSYYFVWVKVGECPPVGELRGCTTLCG